MSQYREQLIQEGKLIPVQTKQITERIAKQLYNVAKRVEDGQDSVSAEDIEWEATEADIQDVFRAMGRYVVSTYTENDRLRDKVKRLEATMNVERRRGLPLDPHDDSIPG